MAQRRNFSRKVESRTHCGSGCPQIRNEANELGDYVLCAGFDTTLGSDEMGLRRCERCLKQPYVRDGEEL